MKHHETTANIACKNRRIFRLLLCAAEKFPFVALRRRKVLFGGASNGRKIRLFSQATANTDGTNKIIA